MAAISVLEAQITDAIRTVSSHENIELRKGFAALRRTAHLRGNNQAFITKRDYMRLFDRVQSPLIKLSDKENLFCDKDQAIQLAYETEVALEKQRRKEYNEWAQRKDLESKKCEDNKVVGMEYSSFE